MKAKKMTKKYLVFSTLIGIFFFFNFTLAQECPSLTTVKGTTVTFVGELTDTGGDSQNVVWFEYGKTPNFGFKTPQKTLTQPEIYCISVSDLEPCTTYYYRAVAQNSAGVSYGETKTFTTACSELKIAEYVKNLSDGTGWVKEVRGDPGEVLAIKIEVEATSGSLSTVILKHNFSLPEKIKQIRNLSLDGIPISGDLSHGIDLGKFSLNQKKVVYFEIILEDPDKFSFGQTPILGTSQVNFDSKSITDSVKINVQKAQVAGAATAVSTGAKNIVLDFIILPLIISSLIVFLFQKHFLILEDWIEFRKRKFREVASQKILEAKIAKLRKKW